MGVPTFAGGWGKWWVSLLSSPSSFGGAVGRGVLPSATSYGYKSSKYAVNSAATVATYVTYTSGDGEAVMDNPVMALESFKYPGG